MQVISQHDWLNLQNSIDNCEVCHSETLFNYSELPPARPCFPIHTGRILLISEAPPITGGFWNKNARDNLRKNVLELIKIPSQMTYQAEIEAFLSREFFLLQALKWPIASWEKGRNIGKTRNFNNLGPGEKRRLIDHSVSHHLKAEIEALSPVGILVLGNAALEAFKNLMEFPFDIQREGVEAFRGKRFVLKLSTSEVPFLVTLLPLPQNFRSPRKKEFIKQDFEQFLHWYR